MIIKAFLAAVTVCAFCVIFSVRKQRIFSAGLIGGVGYLIYAALFNAGELIAVFAASSAMALLAELAARLHKCPVTVLLIPALISLVPGGDMFYSALMIFEADYPQAAEYLVAALTKAGALAVGTVLVSSAFNIHGRQKEA